MPDGRMHSHQTRYYRTGSPSQKSEKRTALALLLQDFWNLHLYPATCLCIVSFSGVKIHNFSFMERQTEVFDQIPSITQRPGAYDLSFCFSVIRHCKYFFCRHICNKTHSRSGFLGTAFPDMVFHKSYSEIRSGLILIMSAL